MGESGRREKTGVGAEEFGTQSKMKEKPEGGKGSERMRKAVGEGSGRMEEKQQQRTLIWICS